MRGQRIYVYKCVVDDGKAPCVDDGLFTLTICKPAIRSTARPGDLIFAFGSKNETPAHRLVYIAVVEKRISDGAYFDRHEFRHRKDCIYERLANGRLELRQGVTIHKDPKARAKDLGAEGSYPKAIALLSTDFRYFGDQGTDKWASSAPNLRKLVETLEQGHRVNFTPEIREELLQLKTAIWTRYPCQCILGKPLHAPDPQADNDDDDYTTCSKNRRPYTHQEAAP